jgi:hypothetical protein
MILACRWQLQTGAPHRDGKLRPMQTQQLELQVLVSQLGAYVDAIYMILARAMLHHPTGRRERDTQHIGLTGIEQHRNGRQFRAAVSGCVHQESRALHP